MTMEPLCIRANLRGQIATSQYAVALDALLGKMICKRDRLPAARSSDELLPLDIPIARSSCGRFYLASFGQYDAERYGCTFIHKPPIVNDAKRIGNRSVLTSINITAGVNKGYRIPVETVHAFDDAITWYCVGDADRIAALLELVPALGRKRTIGFGRLAHRSPFTIERVSDPWDGFPVARDGVALRTLPPDHPGLRDPELGFANLEPPYWMYERQQMCALPRLAR